MKTKCFFLTAAFAAMLFVTIGCSNESKPSIEVTPRSITCTSLEETTITTNGTNVTFASRNPYIATVDERSGVVTGLTIGETVIDINSDQGHATVNVEVLQSYDTYTEPCYDFSKTKNQIISMFGTPDGEYESMIAYFYDDATHIGDMYMFGTNNKLSASCAVISAYDFVELILFLCERYLAVGYDDDGYYFVNHYNSSEVTMGVMVSELDEESYMVVYMPYTSTRAAMCSESVAIKEYVKILNK